MDAYDWDLALQPALPHERDCRALEPGREVNIYGSGAIAREVLAAAQKRGLRLRRIIDGNTARTDVNGAPIQRPDDPALSLQERAEVPLLIGIFNRDVDYAALEKKLDACGWTWRIDFIDLHAAWTGAFPDHYWLTGRDFYAGHTADIARADRLWADAPSRDLYRRVLRFRLQGRSADLPSATERQYFPGDIPPWKTPLRLIDVGAYDGDTLRDLSATGLPVEAVAALEPDPDNFAKLIASHAAMKTAYEFTALPCGAWNEKATLSFAAGGGEASALGAGGTVIPCVALDEVLPDFHPTLIKLDIEGAEKEALLGARDLINSNRPGVAVCIYHRPSHIWELPLLLADWNPDYRFYLRAHAHTGFEMVLYAVAA